MSTPAVYRVTLANAFGVATGSHSVADETLVVGTVPGCSVALKDPVASEEHCRIRRTAAGFVLEDLESGVGTYLNGIPVEEPTALTSGDVVIVGVSRLVLSIEGEGAASTLAVDVAEASFHYVQRAAPGQRRDADLWVASEVTFGRVRAVRIAGWASAALALLFLGLAWLGPIEARLLPPGPLSPAHAQLFADSVEVLRADPPRAHLADQAELAQAQGCGVCHDAFDRTPVTKCAACHGEMLRSAHPFHDEPVAASPLSERGLRAHDCLMCHDEHHGSAPPGRPLRLAPRESCHTCHAEATLAQNLERLEGPLAAPEDVEPPRRRAPVGYDAFSHRAHTAPDVGIACSTCHAAADAGAERDYAPVTFETCMRCHDADAEAPPPELEPFVQRLARADRRVSVPWHGSDDESGCEQCHAPGTGDGSPRTVTARAAAPLAFRLRHRDHAGEFHAGIGGDPAACIECHLAGAPAVDPDEQSGPFLHGVHLSALAPRSEDDAAAQALSDECRACHDDQASSTSLAFDRGAEVYHGSARARCNVCHRDAEGSSLVLGPRPSSEDDRREAPDVVRRDFSHAAHVDAVPGGCFACHVFDDADDLFSAHPRTGPGVADCTACHAGHRNIAGGACGFCHPAPGAGGVDPIYRGETIWRDDWPVQGNFSHSGRGHRDLVDQGACESCHEGTAGAGRVAEVPIPWEGQPVCVECHMRERFHFQVSGR